MASPAQYTNGYWTSPDGLKLHYRDYAGPKDRPPILCIPGLTRNARDYEMLADRHAGRWRMICVNLRGRGGSEAAADPASYTPMTYLADVEALLTTLKIRKFIGVGTSLGGLVTMLLAMAKPGRLAGAIINDVGPVVEAAGLDRIRAYVGRFQSWQTWVHAARALQEAQGDVYPHYDLMDWLAMAKRLNRLTSQGRVVPDYDMRIAEPMKLPAPAVDLWPGWDALGDAPTLIVRGALSDILSKDTARDMVKRRPAAKLVTVPDVGHAPALDEPAAMRGIDAFLRSLAG